MAKGYIRLYRGIQDNWIWQDKPFSKGQAWVDLLILANHSDHKSPYGDKVIVCSRGEVNRSIRYLAERWGWGREKVRTFLKQLEADEMISLSPTTKPTTILIENYTKYQVAQPQNQPTTDQEAATNLPRGGQEAAMNNKCINDIKYINAFNDLNLSLEGKAKWAALRAKAGR